MRLMGIALFGVVGCASSTAKRASDTGTLPEGPTFYQDVLPIVGENCQGCHNEAEPMGAAFPLESYDHVAPFAEVLLAKMQPEGDPTDDPFFMPPVYARDTEECDTWLGWRGTYQANATEVGIFDAWIAVGKPEGDPDNPADFSRPELVKLEGEDLIEVSYKGDFQVPAPTTDTTDTLRCFAVETTDSGQIELGADRWVDGFEFTPGNSLVAHHMLAYTVPDLEDHLDAGLAEDTSNNSWGCAGGPSRDDGSFNLPSATLLYGWVPGSQPLVFEDGMAMQLEAGTGLVVQMHFNTLSVGSDTDMTDRSTLRLRTADVPTHEARIVLFGVASPGESGNVEDPPFLVPAGVSDHVESYAEVMPDSLEDSDVRVWGVVPHMHLAGTSLKFTRTRTTGEEDCLAHVPRWDFNWQRFYLYDGGFLDLPRLRGGETLRISCTLDNTDDNIFLDRYLGGAVAAGVELGESTSEEMCLIAMGLACDGICPAGI